jgi:cytochrome oxidase Cu insertion factor (SCO1/SenC/PrrC family)
LYEKGKGTPRDFAAALKWYQAAWEHGADKWAAYRLGQFYENGWGVDKDMTPWPNSGTRWPAAPQQCVVESASRSTHHDNIRDAHKGHALWRMAMKDVCLAIIASIMMALSGVAVAGDQSAGMGGPFELVDQYGRRVTDADFRGRLMLIYFGYTFCPDACPTTLFAIGQAMVRLTSDERKRVAPIFITVDPERDTQKVLADYVASFSPDLVGLAGPPEAVQAVEREYQSTRRSVWRPTDLTAWIIARSFI